MSVRFGCTLLISLCAGCAGSAARTAPASSPVDPSLSALAEKARAANRAQHEPGLLSMCQDGTASPELRLAWSTRANGTRKVDGSESARVTSAQRARASECVALRAPSVERE